MKKITLLFTICMFVLFSAVAQVPQQINYQAVARNTTGAILASQAVSVRLSFHDGSASGTVVYKEGHSVTTNQFGLFTLKIGTGTVITGVFTTIDWSTGSKFLQVELDPAGGSTFTDMGTQELLSVPFALYAANSGTPGPIGPAGPTGATGATGPAGSANISGTTNRVIKFTGATTGGNSQIFDNGITVGVNNTTPNAASLLDLTSTTKGFLPPRMTNGERDAIPSPPAGLVIYSTTENCLHFFNGTNWTGAGCIIAGRTATFNYTGTVQTWTVPAGITSISIDARGAQGGGSNGGAGGFGARMTGTYSVTPGDVLNIVVGQQGLLQVGGNAQNSSGGGGGTFVYKTSGPTLYVAAGGGGGKCNFTSSAPLHAGAAGQITTNGAASSDGAAVGGTAGNGGAAGLFSSVACSGGGAGWLSVGGGPYGGASYATWTGGTGFCGGGGGGCGGVGGFGGGGGGGNHYGGGGGGGGYSGGGGGTDPTHGGGGGSYSIGIGQVNTAGFQTGNGQVIITF